MNSHISIIIPLFNKEKYIERAIRSVLSQTIQTYELIIIDDGSTDKSVDKVRTFVDARIRLFHQRNLGVSAARNHGISKAKYELVAFLDADDEWRPTFLDTILHLVHQFPEAGAFATAFEYCKEPGGQRWPPRIEAIPPALKEGLISNYFRSSLGDEQFFTSSIVVRKNALERIGGFPERERLQEDLVFFAEIAIHYPIAYSRIIGVTYYLNETGTANQIYRDERGSCFARFAKLALKTDEVPLHLLPDFMEYVAKLQIHSAARYIKQGQPNLSKELLIEARTTKVFKKNWLFWYALSRLPTPLSRLIWKTKDSIFD